MPILRRALASTLAAACVLWSAVAFADLTPEQVAARRQLIEQAQTARSTGDHARALELAELAGKLSMSVSLRRFIAEEQLALGDSAAALGSAELCAQGASVPGSVEAEHRAPCEEVASQAKASVGYIVIKLKSPVADVVVRAGGRDVPAELLGQRYVVTAGSIAIEASARGYKPVTQTARVGRGEEVAITLELTPLVSEQPPPTPEDSGHFRLSPLLPIGAGVALSGFAVAIGVAVSGKLALDDYEERCTTAGAPSSCVAEQTSLQSDLDTRAIVVDTALAVAGVGLVLGTIGIFLSGTTEAQKAALWQGKVIF
ncbi:MAG: hypothetical protein U0271_40460 [Polyangiaceae bacterium]